MPRLATIAYVMYVLRPIWQPFRVSSAVVATALWPLILLGVNLRLSVANL